MNIGDILVLISIFGDDFFFSSGSFPYWPAKKICVEDQLVHVRYFGEHTTDKIPCDNCYPFSSEPPEGHSEHNSQTYTSAIEVCLIVNII